MEILSNDVSRVRRILDSFMPVLIDRNRNRVELEVSGYEDDSRELFLIDEVRLWFNTFFDSSPDLFFWMNMRSQWMAYYAIMFGTPVRRAGYTTVSSEDLQRFLIWGYKRLNGFCASKDISPDPSTNHVNAAIQEQIGGSESGNS
jgi:hypothetical protein